MTAPNLGMSRIPAGAADDTTRAMAHRHLRGTHFPHGTADAADVAGHHSRHLARTHTWRTIQMG